MNPTVLRYWGCERTSGKDCGCMDQRITDDEPNDAICHAITILYNDPELNETWIDKVKEGSLIMETVYIETTIPSFYFEIRKEPEMVARRNWTRQWWDERGKTEYDKVTSQAVIDELSRGLFPGKDDALRLISELELLPIVEEIEEIVAAYLSHYLMPKDAVGDALHLALASYYGCDHLLTWNCKHLANANKYRHIRRINAMMDLVTPNLITPLELLQGE